MPATGFLPRHTPTPPASGQFTHAFRSSKASGYTDEFYLPALRRSDKGHALTGDPAQKPVSPAPTTRTLRKQSLSASDLTSFRSPSISLAHLAQREPSFSYYKATDKRIRKFRVKTGKKGQDKVPLPVLSQRLRDHEKRYLERADILPRSYDAMQFRNKVAADPYGSLVSELLNSKTSLTQLLDVPTLPRGGGTLAHHGGKLRKGRFEDEDQHLVREMPFMMWSNGRTYFQEMPSKNLMHPYEHAVFRATLRHRILDFLAHVSLCVRACLMH